MVQSPSYDHVPGSAWRDGVILNFSLLAIWDARHCERVKISVPSITRSAEGMNDPVINCSMMGHRQFQPEFRIVLAVGGFRRRDQNRR